MINLPFSFFPLDNGGHLFKQKTCSLRSKFFPLRVDLSKRRPGPCLKGFIAQGSRQRGHKISVEEMHPHKTARFGRGQLKIFNHIALRIEFWPL